MTINNNHKTPADDRWRGKRYICLARQSSDADGTTSTEAQLSWLNKEGERLGMEHVDDIVLNGITGSLPGIRKDLEELIKRKREQDDFDVLLVQRLDRLTRGGSSHGIWLQHEFEKAGITLLCPGDDLPDGPYANMIRVAKLEAARDQARSISQRSVQGHMHALAAGRSLTSSKANYGLDRLYLTLDDKPLFRIRNLPDGRQQKLAVDDDHVIDTYGQTGDAVHSHYRKQAHEKIMLVPGEASTAATVAEIFDLRYNHGLGGKRIADRLNSRGVLSPTGKGWSQRQVESIYENPVYCGVALGRKVNQSIYNSHGDAAPEPADLDPQVLATCEHAPRRWRHPDKWVWQEQPLLKDFLPADLSAKALPIIKQLHIDRYERSLDPTRPKKSPSKHKHSEYVLTGILVAKQDGGDLTGVLTGRKGKTKRYYRHRKGRVSYRKGKVYNKLIQAEPLERAVLELIREVLLDAPRLRDRILDAIAADPPEAGEGVSVEELTQKRDAIAKRIRVIVSTLDEDSLADAKPEIDRLQAQRKELDRQLAERERSQQTSTEDPEVLADRVLTRMHEMASAYDDLSPTAKRNLITAFVEKVEVDMATKHAEVELKLPSWALNGDSAMCLAHNSGWPTGCETHHLVPLDWAVCQYINNRSQRRVEYHCRRRKAA